MLASWLPQCHKYPGGISDSILALLTSLTLSSLPIATHFPYNLAVIFLSLCLSLTPTLLSLCFLYSPQPAILPSDSTGKVQSSGCVQYISSLFSLDSSRCLLADLPLISAIETCPLTIPPSGMVMLSYYTPL